MTCYLLKRNKLLTVQSKYYILNSRSRGNGLASRSKFASSNPTGFEVDGFFQDVKILSTSSPGGTLSWDPESEISGSLKNLKPEKIGL